MPVGRRARGKLSEEAVDRHDVGQAAFVQHQDLVHRRAQGEDPGYVSGMSGHETELAGIKTGALYPYVNSTKVFHCTSDASWQTNRNKARLDSTESPYRSYAIQDGLSGTGYFNQIPVRAITKLKRPGNIYVFVEEDEGSGAVSLSGGFNPDYIH